jgi:hypothetical protein
LPKQPGGMLRSDPAKYFFGFENRDIHWSKGYNL